MSKFVEFTGMDDTKVYLDVDEIAVAFEDSVNPSKTNVVTKGDTYVTLYDTYRTVKGRIIKANGEDS